MTAPELAPLTLVDQVLVNAAAWLCTGVEPDPEALAFAESYEGQRADLKAVSGSA